MTINDKSSKKLFDARAKMYGDLNSVLDAGEDNLAKHSNVLHDYFSKKYVAKYMNLKTSDQVLDFGCGVGRLTNFLRPHARVVVGYDASDAMLECAVNTSPVNSCYVSQLEDLGGQNFDVIFAHWVLAHMSDEKILEDFSFLSKLLKNEGRICLFEQTPSSINNSLSNEVYTRRTVDVYQKLFAKLGFKVSVHQHVYRNPSYARSIWNRLQKSNKALLPLLYALEKGTITYKKEHVVYYTTFIEIIRCSKNSYI